MACNKCGAPCQGRFCPTHAIEHAHDGTEATAGTRRTLKAQRADTEGEDTEDP